MKKIALLLIFFTVNAFSQIVENNATPTVIPPSPTAASFMKFEEIPVSHYTGVPEIKIPIFETKLKNGLNFEVKLDYHIANSNTNVVASDCGLGWSLSAGGSISRTVKGLPDEILKLDGGGAGKVGIYQTTTNNHINRFYEYSNILENDLINGSNLEMINEYLWDVNVRGKYDTEHDLYQYNFLGYTGRFYIKKVNNALQIVKLDKNPLQITNTYNNTTYVNDSFTIVDENGNRFIFNVSESSTFSNFNSNYDYLSTFHLSQIFDANNVLLVSFNYATTTSNEAVNLSTVNFNYDKYNVIPAYTNQYQNNGMTNFSPLQSTEINIAQILTHAKKLASVVIEGIAVLNFDFIQGRSDSNLMLAGYASKLNEIYIKDWKNVNYRKYGFVYSYSNKLENRMILSEVNLFNKAETVESKYTFGYKDNFLGTILSKDYWGYFNNSGCETQNLEPHPDLSDIDVIQKIKYPEGGSVVFDFESNTYSYESDVPVTDFDSNPQNWYLDNQTTYEFVSYPPQQNVPQNLNFSSTETQYLDIYPGLTVSDNESKFLFLYKNNQLVRGFSCIDECPNCKFRVVLEPNFQYDLRFSNMELGSQDGLTVLVEYIKRVPVQNQFLLGGGNRIKKIGYFDKDVNQRYYDDYPSYVAQGLPQKELNYDYQYFNNSMQSSGALVFPKPKFNYEKTKRECTYLGNAYSGGFQDFDIVYDVVTLTNNLAAIKTKGADVGYKNVTVFESNNGFRRLVFTNSLDFPETFDYLNLNPPFLPTANIDYKRGLLLEDTYFNQASLPLKKSVNTYSYEDVLENTGIKVISNNNYQFINPRNHTYYSQYKSYITNNTSCFCCFDVPISFTNSIFNFEAFGWAKLDTTTQFEYFYDSSNTLIDTVQSNSSYTYNPINYKIASQSVTDGLNGFIETKFFYAPDASMASKPFRNDLVTRNMIAMPLVTQKYRGSELVFEKETEYGSFASGNVNFPLILPKYLYSKKGNVATNLAVRDVTFDSYDVKGNVTQYTPAGGVPTYIVWAYNKMFPVVKIENHPSTISPATLTSLVSAIQTPSDSPTGTQAQVLSGIESLRGNSNFANSLITSYTYDPLQGITLIKDPKGDISTFTYDLFNRLQLIKDRYGNILKEYEYHFRP